MSTVEKPLEYFQQNRTLFIEGLIEYLKIPSISTLAEHKSDITKATQFLTKHLTDIGLENTQAYETKGHPIVYADWLHAEGKPTILIYGHYDVQPADPLEEWVSPPFEPTIREGNIYARGSTDNKGQHWAHLKAIESFLKTDGVLPVNVKLFIEGEEEMGSPTVESFIQEHKELLKADLAILSDGTKFAVDTPTLYIGMRGLTYMEIRVKTANIDAHSGLFGGQIDNAGDVLAHILHNLKDDHGKILIPGFYDKVKDISDEERASYEKLPFDLDELKRILGVKDSFTEEGFSEHLSGMTRPTLDVNGILSGFTADGVKTIIPYKAMAKVSMRLVPDQDHKEIAQLFENYIKQLTPPTAEVEVIEHHGVNPYVMQGKLGLEEMKLALHKTFNKEPVLLRVGGVIGAVYHFYEVLGIDTVMADLGDPDDNLHAPNEKLSLDNIYKGIEMSIRFMHLLGNK